MPKPIVVVGSLNIDLIFRVPKLPAPGETRLASDFLQTFGGKGANQAVMAARLGAAVSLIGKVGDDGFGASYLRHLQQEGVNTGGVSAVAEAATGLASICVDDNSANCIIVHSGANSLLLIGDVRKHAEKLRSAAMVIAQLETPMDATTEAFRIARSAGVPTLLNPAPAQPLSRELLGFTTLLIPNEHELKELSGHTCRSDEETLAAARSLREQGPETVIVTLGERGSVICDNEVARHILAPKVKVVDTTGAGDAFCGALAVGVAENQQFDAAVRFATHAAALAVTRPGTQVSFPHRADVVAAMRVTS